MDHQNYIELILKKNIIDTYPVTKKKGKWFFFHSKFCLRETGWDVWGLGLFNSGLEKIADVKTCKDACALANGWWILGVEDGHVICKICWDGPWGKNSIV